MYSLSKYIKIYLKKIAYFYIKIFITIHIAKLYTKLNLSAQKIFKYK